MWYLGSGSSSVICSVLLLFIYDRASESIERAILYLFFDCDACSLFRVNLQLLVLLLMMLMCSVCCYFIAVSLRPEACVVGTSQMSSSVRYFKSPECESSESEYVRSFLSLTCTPVTVSTAVFIAIALIHSVLHAITDSLNYNKKESHALVFRAYDYP